MDRLRDVSRFWNWLPAFRAAAETQHLPSAARQILTSASALSRSIRLLEKNLGVALFRRVGRRLELAPEGESLLGAVRDAMRLVHETTSHLDPAKSQRPLRIASLGVATTALLAPAIARLRSRDPGWQAILSTPSASELRQALLRGVIDLALHTGPTSHEDLVSSPVAHVRSAVYCGKGHPLYRARKVRLAQVLKHEFVAPPLALDGSAPEGWPAEIPRKVAVQVDQLRVGMELCARGDFLAVLPELLVATSATEPPLWRLPGPELPVATIFATRRPTLARTSSVEVLVDAVAAQATALGLRA